MGSNPALVIFFFLFSFSFFKYLESVLGSNIAPDDFHYSLYCTIPLCTFNIPQTHTTPTPLPQPRYQTPPPPTLPPPPPIFFLAISQLVKFLVHIHPDPPTPGPPPDIFFHFHNNSNSRFTPPSPPPGRTPSPPPPIYFCIFTIPSILGSNPP